MSIDSITVNVQEVAEDEEISITGKYEPVQTTSIKSSLSLVVNLSAKNGLDDNIEETIGPVFENIEDVEIFKKGGKLYFSIRGLYLDLLRTKRSLLKKLPQHISDAIQDLQDKRIAWSVTKIPTFDGVSHPVFQSNADSGIRKRLVTIGIEDTSNDPYGKALYKYNVLNDSDVYEDIKPTNPLRLLMHAHPDRYRKEHLPKFTEFEYSNKNVDDTDNNVRNRRREQNGQTMVEPDLEIGLMSMELGERSVFSIPKSGSKDDESMNSESAYIDVTFDEIVFQETGCKLCGCTSETGEKVGINKDDGRKVPFVFMRNLCCGKVYSCVACPLCIRMCGFIISILSVFQIFLMEMCQ
jgi:hypothetical protein